MHANNNISNKVLIELRRIMRAIDLHSRKLVQECALTGPQLLLLQSIIENEEISLGELAKRVSLSNATVSGIIDRLERREMVERRRSERDRRQIFVRGTEKARSVMDNAPPLLQERFVSELADLQKWEREQILSSLSRIAHMMNAENLDASPVLASHPLTVSDKILKKIVSENLSRPEAEERKGFEMKANANLKFANIDRSKMIIHEIYKEGEFPSWIDRESLAHFLHENLKPYEDTVEDIRKSLDYVFSDEAGKGGYILIGEIDSKPVGALVMLYTGMESYIPENILLFIAVDPAARGMGIGGSIIKHAFEISKGDVKLHVEYDNPAKRLYERLGMTTKYAEMRYHK
jgi:DNA-binding MarR family transcriptional regulator/ribosomal protein S18 acetylase RimI-like enzyme